MTAAAGGSTSDREAPAEAAAPPGPPPVESLHLAGSADPAAAAAGVLAVPLTTPLSPSGLPVDWEVLFGRMQWMMLIRILMVTVLFGVLLFVRGTEPPAGQPVSSLYHLFIAFYLLSILYAAVANRMPNLSFFTYLQFAVDAACIGMVILFTGGSDSGFTWLFVFNILGAGYLLLLPGGLVVASLDTLAYVGCLALSWTGFVPNLDAAGELVISPLDQAFGEAAGAYSTVAFHVVSFYLLAFLSGSLAKKQADTGRALAATASSLHRLQDMHGRIVQNIDAGLLTVSNAGLVTSFNRAAEVITRHMAVDVIGLPASEVLRGIDHLLDQSAQSTTSALPGHSFERWMTRKDRKRIYLRVSASAMRSPDGTVDGTILVFEDRTRMLLMEEQLEREERLAAVGRLSAGIAHEIRNPLASITGSVQVLRGEAELLPEEDQLLRIVEREADRLGHLVTDFLALTRDEKVALVPGHLAGVVRDTLSLLQSKGGLATGVEIIPDLEFDPVVRFEEDRIRQVLWNLVNNACQAMNGDGTLRVRTEEVSVAELSGGNTDNAFVGNWSSVGATSEPMSGSDPAVNSPTALRVVVQDSGPGISDEALGRIFDPFYTTHSGGTGLGLAIVARIVQAHQGVITVHSQAGEGTRFSVWLPIHAGDAVDGAQ
jgi:two-component system sensor histidine kinase PilS (NtrC family)